jgi:hypothetical protein
MSSKKQQADAKIERGGSLVEGFNALAERQSVDLKLVKRATEDGRTNSNKKINRV